MLQQELGGQGRAAVLLSLRAVLLGLRQPLLEVSAATTHICPEGFMSKCDSFLGMHGAASAASQDRGKVDRGPLRLGSLRKQLIPLWACVILLNCVLTLGVAYLRLPRVPGWTCRQRGL